MRPRLARFAPALDLIALAPIALAALGLGACSFAPVYHKPDLTLPAAFVGR